MRKVLGCAVLALLLSLSLARGAEDRLAAGFQNPPDSARPQTWWHWMNGNVTKEGITADLEAMKRVGIGGAEIFVVDEGIPAGKASFMSPQFQELFKHAASEADRLGLELCMHNCAGWSSSGGPWNTPEHAMQFVTMSEAPAHGPATFSQKLAQPPTQLNFYRDIAVLAFKLPGAEIEPMAKHNPKVTTSASDVDAGKLIDGDAKTEISLPKPEPRKPAFIQVQLDAPLTVRTVAITPGKGFSDCGGDIAVSDDGQNFRAVRPISLPRNLTGPMYVSFDEPVTAKFFRIVLDHSGSRTKNVPLAEIDLTPRIMVENVQQKAGFQVGFSDAQSDDLSSELAIRRDQMIDLTDKLRQDGTLNWDVPKGDWTILRIGYTPTGKTNHPAPPEATGPECDKFSTEALDAHWNGYVQKILDDLGPLAPKALNDVLIDSYEVGGQNWTPKMKQEFEKRRGYDLTRFLPVLSGKVVDSSEASDRFLWDLRRTIADLFAENYYGHFAELCHRHGLKASIEPYTGPFESLQCGQPADIVMGEFWTGSQGQTSIKLASSVAHIYGKSLVGAESFTAAPPAHGRWQEDPYQLKALGDLMECQGINRFIFHRYAMQPWMDKYPGMTMGQWGFNMERTNTWFEQSTAWLKYIARCQYLLQQGRFIADVAYFCGESAPVEVKSGDPPMPPGYDYDNVNKDVLMQATVNDGRVTLPSGMSYAVLVLPKTDRMTPEFAAKIRDLAKAGATIVGPKPVRSPSLQNFPKCDEDVKAIAEQAWGNLADKGKVIASASLGEVFAKLNLTPDFQIPTDARARMVYIHRLIGDDDVYFVSNQRNLFSNANVTFRVSGKVPYLWHPDSGVEEQAPVYSEADGRITLPIGLDPSGSVFVVFRKTAAPADHIVQLTASESNDKPAPKITIQSAAYEAIDNSGSMDVTADLKAKLQSGIDKIEVVNSTFGQDPASLHPKQLRVKYTLSGRAMQSLTPEGQTFDLSTLSDAPTPAYELATTADGQAQLLAWRDGSYDFKTADGKSNHIDVAKVADPINVEGPWELSFPPHWGAPDKITLDKLISWTDSSEEGVKYFSGTATYHKSIDVSSDMLGADRAVYLDLGRVKNLAQVKLNGKDLGILWKPPFRTDIRSAAKPGANELEVSVTNLWPNRLIGDEKKGLDAEWDGKKLARWPQWLLDGKPSPSGRYTFTTWHHWTADMTPLESGLIGPVTLQSVQRVPLK